MLRCLSALGLLLAVVGSTPARAATYSYQRIAYSDGRYFDLYVPPGLSVEPELYLVLPGSGQHVEKAEASYGMQAEADAHHFLIAYVAGWHSLWDAGTCCVANQTNPPDDVAFLDRVVDTIRGLYPSMNPGLRVVGFSAGGMMAYTYACQRPNVVGAAAVAGAWVSTTGCNRPPLRIYHVHGVEDQLVPYFGGYSPFVGATFEPVLELHTHFPTGTAFHLHTVPDMTHWWPSFAASEIYNWLQ